MPQYYRKKTGGLCYKLIAEKVSPWRDSVMASRLLEDITQTFVVIQHHNSNSYLVPSEKFWEEFERVETKNLPTAYRKPGQMYISIASEFPHGFATRRDAEFFRRHRLVPALDFSDEVVVNLDDCLGWASFALEEIFGGLISKEGYSKHKLKNKLVLQTEDQSLIVEALQYINEAVEMAPKNNRDGSVPGIGDGTLVR